MTATVTKDVQFKVASVSENMNSFGLYGMILMAENGETWEVGANSLNVKEKGEIITVQQEASSFVWYKFGFEIPRWIGRAPQEVIKEIWK